MYSASSLERYNFRPQWCPENGVSATYCLSGMSYNLTRHPLETSFRLWCNLRASCRQVLLGLSYILRRKSVPIVSYRPVDQIRELNHGPSNPQNQGKPVWNRKTTAWLYTATVFVCDLILTLLPIAFIGKQHYHLRKSESGLKRIAALATYALAEDGKSESTRGQMILRTAKLGPTIFPIVFAAVVGRLMRTYALWRAERCKRLGVSGPSN